MQNRPELAAVPDLPDQEGVSQLPVRRRLNWDHLSKLGSLPDNVFILRPNPDDNPPDIAA